MSQSQIHNFQQLFPGPYSIQPGTNGVDATFDIYCQTTGEHIISTDYWYEEERAQRDAAVIAIALETMRHAPRRPAVAECLQLKLDAFQAEYPAPYESSAIAHDGWVQTGIRDIGNEYFIVSLASGAEDEKAELVTGYIARALNNLFQYVIATS